MVCLRKRLSHWTSGSLCWSTQFNDLRRPISLGQTPDEQERTILRELKIQGLFQNSTAIRDADLVNHSLFLKIILENKHSFQSGLLSGTHVLSLRSDVESFTEINEIAGLRRAFPERYELVKPLVSSLDSMVNTKDMVIGEMDAQIHSDVFLEHLIRTQNSSYLSLSEQELLTTAIQRAKSLSGPYLRFGDIYDFLVRDQGLSPFSDIVQWCRAAHVLTVPSSLGIAPLSSNLDLIPAQVDFVLGYRKMETIDPLPWIDLFPKKILTDEGVDKLTFEDIVRCRHQGVKIGYFTAVKTLQLSIGSQTFEPSFASYLEALEQYLIMIGLDTDIKLAKWQELLARQSIATRELKTKAVIWGIPIIIATACSINTFSPISFAWATALGTGIEILRSIHKIKTPAPLERLLSGTTISPPYGKRKN